MSQNKSFYKAPRYLFRKKNILSWLKKIHIKTFIDVGCGAGDLDCSIASLGIKGKGIDFSPKAIATGKSLRKFYGLSSSQLEFTNQDAFDLAGKERYDLVVCCEVLEHVEDDSKLLKTLISLSNRYVLISVPAKEKLFDEWDTMVGHYRRYEKNTLSTLLHDNSLEIIHFASYGFPFTDIVRYLRRIIAKDKDGLTKKDMKIRTQASGVNPVKPPRLLYKIDLEKLIIPFYWFSRLFNRFDLSEGYLVLCEKKDIRTNK